MSLARLLAAVGADDTGRNVPESLDTLLAQRKALVEGRQRAQMFPRGTPELPLPDGMQRIETARGVFHYAPALVSAEQIEEASAGGRENEILGLGPASKADVAALAARGEPVAVAEERDPAGREVKAALVTPSTAAPTLAEMERRKANANAVSLRSPAEVVAARAPGGALSALLAATREIVPEEANGGTFAQSAKLLARGATAEGVYPGIEGTARAVGGIPQIAASVIERLEGLRDAASDLSPHEQIARAEQRRAHTAERLRDLPAEAPRAAAALDAVRGYADAVRATRVDIRRALPVDEDFAQSTGGQILQGIGQAAGTLPLYALPGIGQGAAVGQVFQAGYDDAKASGASDDAATRAAVASLPAAAIDVAADKLVIGKLLKPLRGRVTVGQLLRDVGGAAGASGVSQGVQQLWQNFVARELEQYDPDRKLDDHVIRSVVVGATVGGLLSAGGQLRARGGNEQHGPAAADGEPLAQKSPQSEDFAPVVMAEGIQRKPALGKPVEAVAAAIARRPDEDFKAALPARLEAGDVDVVSHLARYGEMTRRADEDFPAFAERLSEKFGDKVQAYLPLAWESVNEGRPVKDLVSLENPVKLDATWKRAAKWGRLFWEGSADVLRRAGVRSLADAIDTHVDLAERNLGKAWAFVAPAVEKFQGLGGAVHRSRAKLVFDEFEAFYRAKENGRLEEAAKLLSEAHPETRRLIDGVQRMFEFTGQEARRLGVKVQDGNGRWRPIGYLGREAFPRMLREDVAAVLRDPSSNPKLWLEMQQQLAESGLVVRREEAAEYLAGQDAGTETATDFMRGLEKARAARLPEQWYHYRFEKVVPRYVSQWAERAAQIEAFGQKTGMEGKDAFDHAREMTNDAEAQRYISAAQDHAYRVNRMHPGARRALGNVTGATTALFLGNPYSTLRNLIGGTAQTVNQFGVLRSVGALRQAWKAMPDAEAAGALKADVADMLFHDDGTAVMRKAAGTVLKMAGFNAVENFVRAHNYITAKTYLRDALRVMRDDPTSKRAAMDARFLRRMGMDVERLAAEGMRGPETERFLRGAVRESQGGYRYNQVPLFVDSPLGRFLFQFARWGTQATRFHAEHVFKPAIFGEEVQFKQPGGGVATRRVRTLLPLLRSPLVAAAAGATTYALREALFGLDRPDATWDEVFRTLDTDQQRAFELALGRGLNDVIMGGTFGALSDYGAMLKDAAERTRWKNPIEPPAASLLKEAGLLAYKLAQQGKLSSQDYREFAEHVATGYRYGKALTYRFADAAGADWAAAREFQAERDRRFARMVGRRFADEAGFDVAEQGGGLPRVNENSPAYDELEAALIGGDAGAVSRIRAQFLAGARDDSDRADRLSRLRTSALGRQPIKPGGRSAADVRAEFVAWARRRLPPDELRRIVDIQRHYLRTGQRGGLFSAEDVTRYAP